MLRLPCDKQVKIGRPIKTRPKHTEEHRTLDLEAICELAMPFDIYDHIDVF